MEQKALALFQEAWQKICAGLFFDEQINTQFDYMLKSLLRSNFKLTVQSDIITALPKLFEISKNLDTPPPYIYILASTKDKEIITKLQELSILEWIKSNASENSTFQVINLLDTLDYHNYDVKNMILAIIKNMSETMDRGMLQATLHIICLKHPEVLDVCLKKLLSFKEKKIIKEFVKSIGRKAVLNLIHLIRPNEIQEILK